LSKLKEIQSKGINNWLTQDLYIAVGNDLIRSFLSCRKEGARMEFALTKEQEMVRKTAREFAEKEIAPIAADIDERAEFPAETVRKLGALGFMGMTVPKEWAAPGWTT
jgi:hypothetical protein